MPPGASSRQLPASMASNSVVIAGEMKNGAAQDNSGEAVRKRRPLERLGAKVLGRQRRRQRSREAPHFREDIGVVIEAEHLPALTHQVDEIPPEPAAGVENRVARPDTAAKDLIKPIDVD